MIYLLRLLPIILLIGLVDFSFFSMIFDPLFLKNERITATIYWSIPILSIAALYFFPRTSSRAIIEPVRRDVHSSILILYLAKFLTVIIFCVIGLFIGATAGLSSLIFSTAFDTIVAYQYLRIGALFIALFLALNLLLGMYFNRYRYKVHHIDVPIKDLSEELEGFKLIQLSDIHSGSFTDPKFLDKGIEKINELQADLVCFTGDLVNNVADEIEPYISRFGKIKAKNGVFAILGNHDYGDYVRWGNGLAKSKNLENLIAAHDKLGWHLLRDDAIQIPVGKAQISLLGVENISAKGRFKNYGNLGQAYNASSNADLKILLSHDPSHWRDEVLEYPDIQLCLSGHTHGMQFGFEWGKLFRWSPVKYVYKEWAGLYKEGEQYLYVNRGFGFLGYPGRVGILPEITQIRFTRASG